MVATQLNYHHLRYFWAVAHGESLTATARALRLSQSALSVQIKQLEEELGHRLFERRGRRLHLTEVGRIALDHADAIFATGDDLVATLAARRGARAIPLRAGALATLSRNFQIAFFEPLLSPRRPVAADRLRANGRPARGADGASHRRVVGEPPSARQRRSLPGYLIGSTSSRSASSGRRPTKEIDVRCESYSKRNHSLCRRRAPVCALDSMR